MLVPLPCYLWFPPKCQAGQVVDDRARGELVKEDDAPEFSDWAAAFEDRSGLKERCIQQCLIVARLVLTFGRRGLFVC